MKYALFPSIGLLLLFSNCNNAATALEVKPIHKPITELVFATGVLEPENTYNLTVQADGYISQLSIQEGNMVNAGQTVAYIDNKANVVNAQTAGEQLKVSEINVTSQAPALKQIEANIATLTQKMQQDALQSSRLKSLFATGSASKLDYENAELALQTSKGNLQALQSQYASIQLQAKQQYITQQGISQVNQIASSYNSVKILVGGKVYKKIKQAGEFVRKGDVIAVIGNPNAIYAKLSVDENSIGKIQLNQQVAIQLNTKTDKVYKGLVYEILPSFNENTQSFIVKVKFTDTLDFTIAGTQLEANITIKEKKDALLIPRSYMGFGNTITLKNDSIKTITTGIVSSEWIEVLGGITDKDILVPLKPKKK